MEHISINWQQEPMNTPTLVLSDDRATAVADKDFFYKVHACATVLSQTTTCILYARKSTRLTPPKVKTGTGENTVQVIWTLMHSEHEVL